MLTVCNFDNTDISSSHYFLVVIKTCWRTSRPCLTFYRRSFRMWLSHAWKAIWVLTGCTMIFHPLTAKITPQWPRSWRSIMTFHKLYLRNARRNFSCSVCSLLFTSFITGSLKYVWNIHMEWPDIAYPGSNPIWVTDHRHLYSVHRPKRIHT